MTVESVILKYIKKYKKSDDKEKKELYMVLAAMMQLINQLEARPIANETDAERYDRMVRSMF